MTVPDLAAAAGVDPDEIDHHVVSLEHLLTTAFLEVADGLLDIFAAAFEREDDSHAGLEAGTAAVVAVYAADPAVARLCELEMARAGSLARAARNEGTLRWVRYVADAFGGGSVPGVHFEVLRGALCGALAEEVARGELTDVERVVRRLLRIARPLLPAPSR